MGLQATASVPVANSAISRSNASPRPQPLSSSVLWSSAPGRGGGASEYTSPINSLGWKGSPLRGEGLSQVLEETCSLWPLTLVTLATAERVGPAQNGQLESQPRSEGLFVQKNISLRKAYRCPLHLPWSLRTSLIQPSTPRSLATACPTHGATQVSGHRFPLHLPTLGPRRQGRLAQFPMGP